jgi:hypothetical protein
MPRSAVLLPFALALLATGLRMPAHAETVAEVRAAAMEAIRQSDVTAYAFSTCRWIRRRNEIKLLERWRRDNAEFVSSARVIVEGQGGMTDARRKVVEALSANDGSMLSASPEACEALFERTRSGQRDLATMMPPNVVRMLLQKRIVPDESELWVLEERRRPDGTLGKTAHRYEGSGGMDACDDTAAAKGHIWARGGLGVVGAATTATDPDLWLAECVRSDGDPTMTEAVNSTNDRKAMVRAEPPE